MPCPFFQHCRSMNVQATIWILKATVVITINWNIHIIEYDSISSSFKFHSISSILNAWPTLQGFSYSWTVHNIVSLSYLPELIKTISQSNQLFMCKCRIYTCKTKIHVNHYSLFSWLNIFLILKYDNFILCVWWNCLL